MNKEFLEVGKIVNTHGLKGEVKIITWTDYPEQFELFDEYLIVSKDKVSLTVEQIRYQKNNLIVKFKDIDNLDQAQALKNTILMVKRSKVPPLPENVYYICDLIGLAVLNEKDQHLGVITDVFSTGSNDVYVVKPPQGQDILIPVIQDVVLQVSIPDKIMKVKLPEGLIEE